MITVPLAAIEDDGYGSNLPSSRRISLAHHQQQQPNHFSSGKSNQPLLSGRKNSLPCNNNGCISDRTAPNLKPHQNGNDLLTCDSGRSSNSYCTESNQSIDDSSDILYVFYDQKLYEFREKSVFKSLQRLRRRGG